MPRLAKSGTLVFLGAIGVLAAAPSTGATFGFSWPPGREALAAGSSVNLAWSLPADHDEVFGEMELVLSLDGGRTFPIRLTRDLSPATRALALRVPALPSPHARLALRVGDAGEPADEEILLVSEEFAIEVGAVSRLEPTAFVRGEWRTLEALQEGKKTAQPIPGIIPETGPAVAPAKHRASATAPRQRPAAAERPTLRTVAFKTAALSDQPSRRPGLPRIPADTPRRE